MLSCKKECGVVYCSRLCLNRDIQLHKLNCEKDSRFPPALGCDYCHRLVDVSAHCEECDKVAVCYRCRPTHLSECGKRGLAFTTRTTLSQDIEVEILETVLRQYDIRKHRLHIIYEVVYDGAEYNTTSAACRAVTTKELSTLTSRTPTMLRFNRLTWSGQSNIAAGLILVRNVTGEVVLEQYKTFAI
jgi:hypothetical protein